MYTALIGKDVHSDIQFKVTPQLLFKKDETSDPGVAFEGSRQLPISYAVGYGQPMHTTHTHICIALA